MKLRAETQLDKLHVVLIEPEIPPNTGAVARTCAATQSALHLVGKLGFRIDEQAVRRAGLDYWPLVDLHVHDDFDACRSELPEDTRLFAFTANTERSYLEADFQPGDTLIFGKESRGLDPAFLERPDIIPVAIPTLGAVRSLNLSNAVAVSVYEALRSIGALQNVMLKDDAIGKTR